MKYTITQSRLLYVYSIGDRKHKDLLKVGEVFVDNDLANLPNDKLYPVVRKILDERTYMKGVTYHLEYVECTTYAADTRCYSAEDVYRTLTRDGVAHESFQKVNKEEADIWFNCGLDAILKAIKEIKNGQGAGHGKIIFRPEQKDAIDQTVKHFKDKTGKSFLWNAKMRFGKTLCALEVARRLDYQAVLIITHRPVVDKGWSEDFDKIFKDKQHDYYATRMDTDEEVDAKNSKPNHVQNITLGQFKSLAADVKAEKKRLVLFVSMQYLRLSQLVHGKEKHRDPLKEKIMTADWDMVLIDEAHEGIESTAGVRVLNKIKEKNPNILSLSGTPFNLLDKFDEDAIYTWDYVMEQRAKQEWDDKHYGDPNPYAVLPRMQILTFTLPKMVRDEKVENNETFKFHEFFRVWTEEDKTHMQSRIDREKNELKKAELKAKLNDIVPGKFVHEADVRRFVKKLHTSSNTSMYPFSNKEFREKFRHTFWLLPGVPEAAAMEQILREDDVFGGKVGHLGFHIINAAGDGNIEDPNGSALADVLDNIRGNAEKNITAKKRTITLSCGKLTTGVSVPEWTAVLCMKGSENTPAANYMQTIFRVQTHAVLNGRQKSDCYVFDFAPDRALTAVAETSKMAVISGGKGKYGQQLKLSQKKEEEHLEAFIKLCPVLSMDEGEMGRQFSANQIFEKLNNVYIERAVRSGYADNSLYNPEKLLDLTPEQEKALGDVHDLLGSMPNIWKPENITINKNGLGDTKDAEQVKYVFYLSATNTVPSTPVLSGEMDDENRPKTNSEGWNDEMNNVSPMFKYLFVSHTKLIDGEWTSFSKPVLWREYQEPDKDEEKAKKERDQKNKEKRARMSVLRGVAIRIPLLVYGAEINDDAGEEITIDNFTDLVDDASWTEFMPKGFKKETFNILKDCFDRSIFTGAAKRIRSMVKEADNLNTEDRINKIATIFSYFHNPDKETVLTPWRVVNMQLSDTVGGYCFFNEEFDGNYTEQNQYGENVNSTRLVEQKETAEDGTEKNITKDIFGDYYARILEINSKTGLYPLYMAYSLFRMSKQQAFQNLNLTGERGKSTDAESYNRQADDDTEIWKDVLEDNIFVICRTKMAASITRRTLAGFRKDVRMNVKCYRKNLPVDDLAHAGIIKDKTPYVEKGITTKECDLIDVLRVDPEIFRKEVVRGKDYWEVYNAIPTTPNEDINNMKFKAIVGNPPYQINDGSGASDDAANPIYQEFVRVSKALKPSYLSLIMPSKWMIGGKPVLRKFKKEMMADVHLSKIYDYENDREIFENAHNDGGICYILWDEQYNKSGELLYHFKDLNGNVSETFKKLESKDSDIVVRDAQRGPIISKVVSNSQSLATIISKTKPFGIRKDLFNKPERYPDANPSNAPYNNSVLIWGVKGIKGGAKRKYAYVNKSIINKNVEWIDMYKLFFTTSYSTNASVPPEDIESLPGSACTETFIVIGPFSSEEEMKHCHTYLHTKFTRALIYFGHGTMQVTAKVFQFVPLQNFTAISDIDWTQSIADIDKQLYKKYHLSEDEINFIENTVKPMD
ncbi:Eco57I restriction-modification methylase domain-containing protein [Hallella mizrahii]|uniref:DEAD/DEAH box helicase n=1 Tax=Hallella mizrahii TaxID=2606637 RepID=A0A7K0KFM9_9BACT|nr:Eco57I restriction-modification methylase domain-containing protein [Hallella mizrahii]MST84649.1 DEAD/DEAH box helicase [Hallella mizrahii]